MLVTAAAMAMASTRKCSSTAMHCPTMEIVSIGVVGGHIALQVDSNGADINCYLHAGEHR